MSERSIQLAGFAGAISEITSSRGSTSAKPQNFIEQPPDEAKALLEAIEPQITDGLTQIDESRKEIAASFARTEILREETNRILASTGVR